MTQSYIGAPMIRAEDVRFLTGRASYLDDITRPGMLHAALLRSPHAHALIARTETAEAAAMPGVRAVFTYDDIASLAKAIPIRVFELPGLDRFLQVPLARDKVRHVGEPVAWSLRKAATSPKMPWKPYTWNTSRCPRSLAFATP